MVAVRMAVAILQAGVGQQRADQRGEALVAAGPILRLLRREDRRRVAEVRPEGVQADGELRQGEVALAGRAGLAGGAPRGHPNAANVHPGDESRHRAAIWFEIARASPRSSTC